MHVPEMFICLTLVLLLSGGCESGTTRGVSVQHVRGGNPEQGILRLREYGCTECHTIPRVSGANGLVGPSLDRIGSRTYIAGVMSNTPANMVRWIQDPPAVDPLTAMPQLDVTEADARHIASFLYTLR